MCPGTRAPISRYAGRMRQRTPMQIVGRTAVALVLAWCVVRILELVGPLTRPWTPADLARLDGPAVAWQLAGVRADPQWCRAVLAARKVPFTPVPDRVTGPGCGFKGAVRLDAPLWSPRRPVVTCPLAVALDLWQRDAVRPAAGRRRVTAIEHYGTYSCRAVAGSTRQSQHATANAIDIAGFGFASGTPTRVRGPDNPFLDRVRGDACKLFGTVLGPGYNAAHRDHFHLDMAAWHYCP